MDSIEYHYTIIIVAYAANLTPWLKMCQKDEKLPQVYEPWSRDNKMSPYQEISASTREGHISDG